MIRIHPGADGAFFLYDDDVLCGGAQAAFDREVTLQRVDAPDAVLAEGLVRAVLNVGRERGLIRAVCENEALFPLLDRVGFSATATGRTVDISAFFARGCRPK